VVKKGLLLVSVAYTLALVIASLITLTSVPSLGSSIDDKIYHIVAYCCLSLFWGLYTKTLKIRYWYLMIVVGAIVFGFVLELLQYFLNPNRSYDLLDAIANSIGAVFGTFIASQINTYKLN